MYTQPVLKDQSEMYWKRIQKYNIHDLYYSNHLVFRSIFIASYSIETFSSVFIAITKTKNIKKSIYSHNWKCEYTDCDD